jgi:hypothetical protein
MYWYKTGIAHSDHPASGGLAAGTNIIVPAHAMGDPDQGVFPLRKPSTGEYAPLLSADKGAAALNESFRIAGTDNRFRGVIEAPTRSSPPGIADISVSIPTVPPGIGRKFSNRVQTSFEGIFSDREFSLFTPQVRFCVNSISPLPGYHTLEVLYQFLYILTEQAGRVFCIREKGEIIRSTSVDLYAKLYAGKGVFQRC